MRKLILSICLFIVAIAASAQQPPLTISGSKYTSVQKTIGTETVTVFIVDNILTTEISYTGTGEKIEWDKFLNGKRQFDINQRDLSPDDATGYILNVDDVDKATIWVIDYSKHKPILNDIGPENNQTDQCKNVNLKIDATAEKLNYQTPNGFIYPLTRDFKIKYTTLTWGGTTWLPKDTTIALTMPTNQIPVPAPFCSTIFTLSGDQYADDLGLVIQKESAQYTPVAVICHETSILATRDATNEAERPTQAKQISGSAPLDMQFLSNANVPITQYYKWEIFKDKAIQPFISRTDKDIRNTFTEAGTYKVRVAVSNANACSFSDSIIVTVSESQIKVPNVFTPNGDGYNDEFRVAYKSIISFHCWVYNRWGRLVYEWTDPQKGWDGKIGGKDASPGPYYYVINAMGSDAKKYKLKGDINLLRGTGN